MTGETNLRKIIDNPNWIVQKSHQAAYGLVPLLQDLGGSLRGIEVGVNLGTNSYMLLESCPNIDLLVGVDHYTAYQDWQGFIDQSIQDEVWAAFSQNMIILGPRFKLIKENSANAAKQLEDDSYDFIFIDADHSMKAVLQDLDNYWPKLKSGGIMAGHDSNLFGVNFAITSWAKRKGIDPTEIEVASNNAWWWRKA